MGVENVCVPSSTDHLIFSPVLGLKLSGRFFSDETILRDHACPHCGWSVANTFWLNRKTNGNDGAHAKAPSILFWAYDCAMAMTALGWSASGNDCTNFPAASRSLSAQ